ncbi:MAG: NepR family anti-sigma factor [Paracoccaceae bacterium]
MQQDHEPKNAGRAEPDLAGDPLMGRLKSIYDEVSAEPLPNDLLQLLEKLDEAERNR